MSQEELSERVGVSRQAVSRWKVGDAYPEMTNIVALCSIFHCNINDLINDNIILKLLVNIHDYILEVIELPENTNDKKFTYGKNNFKQSNKI